MYIHVCFRDLRDLYSAPKQTVRYSRVKHFKRVNNQAATIFETISIDPIRPLYTLRGTSDISYS